MWYELACLAPKSQRNRFRPWLLPAGCPSVWPDPTQADSDEGLVAVGGDLSPERLMSAYAQGIFPWFEHQSAILWWCPEPRAILKDENLHASRSLRRRMCKGDFALRIDTNFAFVIDGCAERSEGTWITPDMRAAYVRLHELGQAHSFEVWAESMFHRATDASKIAVVAAVSSLFAAGFQLFDVQFKTPHLASLGVTVLSRRDYLLTLDVARRLDIPWRNVVEALHAKYSES
jgi:leucyl/phenylalanyl-tRNA--protein transferase